MALLGNAKPTPEQLAEFRKNAGKGRIWIYQNLEFGHTDWGKLIFLQKPYAPPAQVTDPVDGTMFRYVLVGYIHDLKTGEIWGCRSLMNPNLPPAPRKPRRDVIEGPWGKKTPEPPEGSGKGRTIRLGLLPPEDRVFTRGPIVAGRPIFEPRRPYTAEDKARNLKIVRDAIAKDGWKPGYCWVNGKWEPPGKRDESEKKGART